MMLDPFFELSQDFMLVFGLDRKLIKANRVFFDHVGLENSILNQDIFSFLHPEDLPAASSEFQKLLDQGKTISTFECRIKGKNEDYVWTSWTASFDPHKQRIFSIGRDISKFKEEKASREYNIAQILEKVPAILYVYDPKNLSQMKFIQSKVGMLGYHSDDFIQEKDFWINRIHPEDQKRVLQQWKEVLKRGSLIQEYRFQRTDGNYIWLRDVVSVLRDEEGEIVEIIGYWSIITGEITLRKQHEQYFRAINQSAIVSRSDKDGNLIFVNENFCQLSGYDLDEVVGQNFHVLDSGFHDEQFYTDLSKTLYSGSPWRGEVKYKRKSGEPFWVYVNIFPVKDVETGSQQFLSIGFDISDEKELETRMIYQEKMATLGLMSGGIAHEINNPLMIIHGKSQILKSRVQRNELNAKDISQIAEEIEKTAMRISRIIKGLRSFSRDAELDPFEINDFKTLIEDTLSLSETRFKNHGIRLEITGLKEGVSLECRAPQISQAFLNILSNSYDAIQDLTKKWIRIEVKDDDDFIEFSVTDSGQGIPKEVQEHLMQPFYTTKKAGRGTGLGLSIAKRMIESHGGSFTYDSSCPNTRFVFRLPKKQNGGLVLKGKAA